jgi:MarR family 2-MHQ and catechol resistance regulon transcriptional repressor
MKTSPSDAYGALLRAAAAVSARVNRRLAPHGLTASRFQTLCHLLSHGPLCPHDIAGRLCQTRGNVTMVLDDLEGRGLVERRREGANRRYRVVHLTPRGRRLVTSLKPRHARAVTEALGPLSARERRTLDSLCRRLEEPAVR